MEGQIISPALHNKPGFDSNDSQKSGYEKIYDWVAESLNNADLAANAGPLGLEPWPDGGVVVNLFGRKYLVDNKGVRALDGLPTSFNHLSLAGHYAMSQGRRPASNDFVKLSALSGLPAGTGQGTFDRDAISKPLARRFGHDPDGLEKVALKIGGRVELRVPGQVSKYIFEPFPRIPIKLVFEEPDEEYDPEFLILYDSSCSDYMEFEALAFLGGVLMKELLDYNKDNG
jgi:hypothetical protein